MKRILCLILIFALLLCGCEEPELLAPGTFYYNRTETSYQGSLGVVAAEQRELWGIEGDLDAILELYCQGPTEPGLENPLPPGLDVPVYELTDGVLTLRFGAELAQLSGVELTVAAGCLARTFLPLTGAEELVLTADGALLNGDTALHLTLAQLHLQDNSLDRLHAEFTIYYASTDRRHLIGHEISLMDSSREELPMHLLQQLLTPPEGRGLRSALPAGTRFLSVTTVDGLCTVDVSEEFDNRRFYAMSAQCLSLLSVVNTLTALEGIDRVEFTVDGNPLIRYGSLAITEPLVRDERCIGPVRTGLGEQEALIYLVHGPEKLLVPTPARLRPSANNTLPELVIRQLLQDPGTNNIRSFIPQDTELINVYVEDGTCYVDLTAAYLTAPEHLLSSNRVIAASMCELDGVERVQILVNGSVPEGFDDVTFGFLTPEDDWFL